METETASAAASEARLVAAGLSRDGARGVTGPLKGYHHEAYAIRLPADNPLSTRYERGKLRVPRPGLLWFDQRYFASDDQLLIALRDRVTRIPDCVEHGGRFFQGFVEGRTLPDGMFGISRLSGRHLRQLGELFAETAAVKPGEISVPTVDEEWPRRPVADRDTRAFLAGLIDFTEHRVYREHLDDFGSLFGRLGVSATALDGLRQRARNLTKRPFALVHGDLHRRNLIVDSAGDLWFIDWELAMIGDPLYDLATHLHLMDYPECDVRRVKKVWREAVEAARPGGSKGWERDLPVLLAFKRAQSVYTDVIRTALALAAGAVLVGAVVGGDVAPASAGPEPFRLRLTRAARKVQRVLATAKEALGLPRVPGRREIRGAYAEWLRERGRVVSGG
ncbi:phosphotransferase [Streptomyces sp. CBMA152]|uniref:phosphotransferase n=1 Tax=Streptomyces sp. CBMA152 TaxID=1896312 RepID=UPI001660A4B0|nr:phosphotransferase [Streptomyces sp. CBMA152]MBD0746207.1 hypothetical protein [Streptomyces sp. CBMA152]